MHLLVRETRSLDEEARAVDLGHAPADLVFLSFSDSDLGAAAAAWEEMGPERPSLRLANLERLRHPMSVDLYAEQVIARARVVVVRLLGGVEHWRYGIEELAGLCRQGDIALALLPGDDRDDPRLAELSTLPTSDLSRLTAYFRHGGPENVGQALALAGQLGGLGFKPTRPPAPLPRAGVHVLSVPESGPAGLAAIVFYRSHLLAGDIAPITALSEALCARGLGVRAMYASSLKESAAAGFVADRLRTWRPSVVLTATGFSARGAGAASPLDEAGVPVLQLILAGTPREAWQASTRGVSQADLAMQVVLPELDGRLLTTAIAFKSLEEPVPGLDYARAVHRPDADGIALAAGRASGWARLAAAPRAVRRVAILLSDYPGAGGGQLGHALGLDSLASLDEIARLCGEAGYTVEEHAALAERLCSAKPAPILDLASYERLVSTLPTARTRIEDAWGAPEADPAVSDGTFRLRYAAVGNLLVVVQPDRGSITDRKASYHDPDLPPRHAYVAFYLWLRNVIGVHALVHLGAHGTLEWLPGKAAALSGSCFPAMLTGELPVIYPFIVNNPGEAACAKRRLGAVTIGHMTPPLKAAGTHGAAEALERMIDEYAAADGLDRRRTALLRREILDHAADTGLLRESGAGEDAAEDDALARLDAYLCDVKELQIRAGLHVFGRAPAPEHRAAHLTALQSACSGVPVELLEAGVDLSAAAERAALLAALDGKLVQPGPAGAPTRGRADVLPTGRNMFTVDPRAIPTRAAVRLAERAAAELLRRHLQDHGDWPKALVIDLWGSTTMRTGGEDLALALVLMGVRPVWDAGSGRVRGIEVLSLALLDGPRVDVTLRISGLFRDAFEAQILLFDSAVRAVAGREENADWNPLAAAARGLEGAALRRATTRIFGAPLGAYGAGVTAMIDRGAWQCRAQLGEAYLAASCHAYGKDLEGTADPVGFAARVAAAEGYVHAQDHCEADILDGGEYAAHEGGFAAAAASLGTDPGTCIIWIVRKRKRRVRGLCGRKWLGSYGDAAQILPGSAA